MQPVPASVPGALLQRRARRLRWSSARSELRGIAGLAWPLALSSVAHNVIAFVDVAMVGRLGATSLAGVSVGSAIFFSLSVVGIGLGAGLDPIVSQAVGAGEGARVRSALRAGLTLAALVSVPLVIAGFFAARALPLVGVDGDVTREAQSFLEGRALGLAPFVLVMALRSFFQARGFTRPLLVAALASNVVNVGLNLLLIYGSPRLGIPALGVLGSGVASTLAGVVQLGVLAATLGLLPPLPSAGVAVVRLREVARFGVPIAVALAAEVFAFAGAGVLAARLGAIAASAHQVALQFVSLTFTVAMAVAGATSTRVGQAVGRGDRAGARRATGVGVALGVVYMLAAAVGFLTVPHTLARLASDQPEVVQVSVGLLLVAATFQVFDGFQAITGGALRGLGDTRTAQAANALGYYVVGLPVGVLLAFSLDLGVRGLWWGLCSGLVVVSLIQGTRLVARLRGPLVRTA
jgi:multidrug resistance protein, MATE family